VVAPVKRTLLLALIVVAVAAAGWLAWRGMPWAGVENKPSAPVSAGGTIGDAGAGGQPPGEVMALGRLEPAEGVISIGALVGDRLQSLSVTEGDVVTQGQALGLLDSQPLRRLEVESLKSRYREAQARLAAEKTLAESRIATAQLGVKRAQQHTVQVEAQQKQVELLKAALALERKNQRRLIGLSDELASAQDRERQTLLVQKAAAELAASEAVLRKMSEEGKLAVEAAEIDRAAAIAGKQQIMASIPIDSLAKTLDLAQLQLDRTILVAPRRGTVLRIYTRPGEFISAKPILQMADLSRMVCVAEVYETDVRHLHPGQAAVVRGPSLPPAGGRAELGGKITRIGRMISTPELKSLDPLAGTARHVMEVRIELDRPSSQRAADFVNLEVDVIFRPAVDAGGPRP
jgi:HlyD family secretion protein